MAEVKVIVDTRPSKIFQMLGNCQILCCEQYEDSEDLRFLDAFDTKTDTDYYLYDLKGNESPLSDDSGVSLSPNDVTNHDLEDDEKSVALDAQDMAMVSGYLKTELEDISDESQDFTHFESHIGLNLPILPGLLPEESLISVPKNVSYDDIDDTEENDSDAEYVPPNRKGCKNVLLWKFLLNALAKAEPTNDVLQWVNRQSGIFKFVDTVKIAQLWGDQKKKGDMNFEKLSRGISKGDHKKKGDMNFEKLSRGIRHYYKNGLMSRVEGRRLVYKFNWKKVPKRYRQKYPTR